MSNVTTSVKIDTSKLKKIKKAFSKGGYVKVGVLGNEASRESEGVNNAELGMIHEFGSLSKNIPPRSFLRMPLETKKNDLGEVGSSKIFSTAIANGDIELALQLIGIKGEEIVNEAFTSSGFGQWAPNAPTTVREKGSSRPLINTGQLRRSITSEVVNGKNS